MSEVISRNPYSGDIVAKYETVNLTQASVVIEQLRSAQQKWRSVPLEQRITLVSSALEYFENNRDEIAKDICEQMGRPFHQSRGEIGGLLERGNYLCSIAKQVLAPDIIDDKPGFDRSIEHAPLGVIFVIAAWNFPLLITINSVVPALIAGNTVLLKHSSLTPKIGMHFTKAFASLGEHAHLLQDIIIDHQTTGQIIESQKIDHVIFTGSVSGGRQILQHTSKRFMQPALELGGKDAAYIHSDADLDYAAATVVDGAMFNSGQSCCGIERVYVHESVYDQFLTKAQALIEKYRLGDPKDPNTDLGPLATAKAADFMQTQIKDAVAKGAKVLVGGEKVQIEKGVFFPATLVVNVDHTMDIMQEENFGPILPMMKVASIDQAIELVNDSRYGLTSAIFTNSLDVAKQYSDRVETGTVFMNRCDYLDPALPWTGVKNSGCGSSLSKYGFYSVTRRKAKHFKTKL